MLMSAALACASASCGYMGVLWCRGEAYGHVHGGMGGVVPPPPRPFYVGEEGLLIHSYLLAMDACN